MTRLDPVTVTEGKPVPLPSQLGVVLPPGAEAALLRALAKKPEERFKSMAELRAALQDVRDVVVLDRNFSPGVGGVLHQELRAALYGMKNAPGIHGYLAGVGGVNVPPQRIMHFARQARAADAEPEPIWVR